MFRFPVQRPFAELRKMLIQFTEKIYISVFEYPIGITVDILVITLITYFSGNPIIAINPRTKRIRTHAIIRIHVRHDGILRYG